MDELLHVLTKDFVSCAYVRFYFFTHFFVIFVDLEAL